MGYFPNGILSSGIFSYIGFCPHGILSGYPQNRAIGASLEKSVLAIAEDSIKVEPPIEWK